MSEKPLVIYVCSPYRGDVETNEKIARGICRKLAKTGAIPIAPHLLFTQFLNDDIPEEREQGFALNKMLLSYCHCVVAYKDEITEGMTREIIWAEEFDKKVYFMPKEEFELCERIR